MDGMSESAGTAAGVEGETQAAVDILPTWNQMYPRRNVVEPAGGEGTPSGNKPVTGGDAGINEH